MRLPSVSTADVWVNGERILVYARPHFPSDLNTFRAMFVASRVHDTLKGLTDKDLCEWLRSHGGEKTAQRIEDGWSPPRRHPASVSPLNAEVEAPFVAMIAKEKATADAAKKRQEESQVVKPKLRLRDVWGFLLAMTGGWASQLRTRRRLRQCEKNECGALQVEGEKWYCTACPCPNWRASELRHKARLQKARCYKNLWR